MGVTSGTVTTTANYSSDNKRYHRLVTTWEEVSVSGNKSTINFETKLSITGGNSSSQSYAYIYGATTTINGVSFGLYKGVGYYNNGNPNSYQTTLGNIVCKGSVVIPHNTDGSKSFSVSTSGQIRMNSWNVSGQDSFTLPTIPQKATFSYLPDYINLDTTVTIKLNKNVPDMKCDFLIINNDGNRIVQESDILTNSFNTTLDRDIYKTSFPIDTNSYVATCQLITYKLDNTYIGDTTDTVIIKMPANIGKPEPPTIVSATLTDSGITLDYTLGDTMYGATVVDVICTTVTGTSIVDMDSNKITHIAPEDYDGEITLRIKQKDSRGLYSNEILYTYIPILSSDYIYTGTDWDKAKPYIYTNGAWRAVKRYIYNNNQWK